MDKLGYGGILRVSLALSIAEAKKKSSDTPEAELLGPRWQLFVELNGFDKICTYVDTCVRGYEDA